MRVHLVCVAAAVLAVAPLARAADPSPAPPQATSSVPTTSAQGLAVVAQDGAIDPAWALARAIYADPLLRPSALDETRARVLVGEKAPADAPKATSDLAEVRAAIKGDDAPSRQLLASIAHDLGVRAVVLVAPPPKVQARVFVADANAFDAATYAPDDANGTAWTGAVKSLERAFSGVPLAPIAPAIASPAPVGSTVAGPSLAVREGPRIESSPSPGKKFYESGWFWGALGAAAFAGGAIFFATRDNSPGTIHLQMTVPK